MIPISNYRYLFFLLLLLFPLLVVATAAAETGQYHLNLSFEPEQHSLQGQARIQFPAGRKWQLFTQGLTVQQITVQEEGKKAYPLPLPTGNSIAMYAGSLRQTVTINYSFTAAERDMNNRIDGHGIVLTSGWHPVPDRKMRFSLSATLPAGFSGISESDSVADLETESLTTVFSQPVQMIHLAAGPYQRQQLQLRDGLTVSTLFFAEDADLSQQYLDAAAGYIRRYEETIGSFPYTHYTIVGNRLPSGLGMPTFTLLGQAVLRLPFIKETSLGHEILHSWFGNSIEVTTDSGNWCEGLTSYLADYSYASDKGRGAEHRKSALVNYQNYIHNNSPLTLQEFHSASHNQPMAKAVRAVGYTRAAMLFHQLHGILGEEYFDQGIRLFSTTFLGKSASWKDLQKTFEIASGKDLQLFFDQQLKRTDMPTLRLTDFSVSSQQDAASVTFTVEQTTNTPYTLRLPILVTGMTGNQTFVRTLSEKKTTIKLPLTSPPLSVSLDPDYDLFRTLQADETPAVWSSFLGAERKCIIMGNDWEKKVLSPFTNWLTRQGLTITDASTITNQQLTQSSLLFLGSDSSSYRSLFGSPPPLQPGFHLTVQKNPLYEQGTVTLVSSSNEEETRAILRKLSHYGSYSSLSFSQSVLQHKSITPTDSGQYYTLESLPQGAGTATLDSFEQILTELAQKRVIYLGESHTSAADHLLQLRIIQGLQQKGVDLGIGMEMFPTSSQEVLDEYVLKQTDMNEKQFLRTSRWFDVWRYDWRLFRPIFNFCRSKAIPIFAINVKKEIVSKVFAEGNTDGLNKEQLQTIAADRDLSMDGYQERLRIIHGYHGTNPHGKKNSLAGFIQSQAIWDESMAENISNLLKKYPEKTLLIIAGSQHTRKDSGIPPRLLRRMNVKQASIVNIASSQVPTDLKSQVDFFFLAEPQYLEPQGKIGVILKPEKQDDASGIRIIGISDLGKAAAAGILKGDILISIEGQDVKTMNDIGIIMMDSMAGDKLKLKVLRTTDKQVAEEKEITVTLSDLSGEKVKP